MHSVSDDGPFGGDPDPLAGMGSLFGDLSRMLGSGNQWDSAAQIAAGIANEGRSEPNVEPSERLAVEALARVAELQVAGLTGEPWQQPLRIEPLNRAQWAKRFLDDQRGLIEGLAGSLSNGLAAQLRGLGDDGDDDPEFALEVPGLGAVGPAMVRQLMQMMGPMMLGMMAGSTAGHLAARALGHYELPLPRPPEQPLTMVLSNVDAFAQEWTLPVDDIRLWVCLSDAAHHRVLCIPHVRTRIVELVGEYTRSFSEDPEEIEQQARELGLDELIGEQGGDLAGLQRLAGDPDLLLGAMRSPHQRELMPRLEAVVAVVEGWVDHVLDEVGGQLLSEYRRVTEALRRRRVEAGPQTRFVEQLLGLEMSQSTFDRGARFVEGILARSDRETLALLWSSPEHLPTAAEIDAPGLWMARLGIEAVELPFEGDLDIPDAPDL
jgi:putative hydrolase